MDHIDPVPSYSPQPRKRLLFVTIMFGGVLIIISILLIMLISSHILNFRFITNWPYITTTPRMINHIPVKDTFIYDTTTAKHLLQTFTLAQIKRNYIPISFPFDQEYIKSHDLLVSGNTFITHWTTDKNTIFTGVLKFDKQTNTPAKVIVYVDTGITSSSVTNDQLTLLYTKYMQSNNAADVVKSCFIVLPSLGCHTTTIDNQGDQMTYGIYTLPFTDRPRTVQLYACKLFRGQKTFASNECWSFLPGNTK